jgi:4a-hydroxytetrahydrobiopterin dehydratase
MPILDPRHVRKSMEAIPGWTLRSRAIRRTFEFKGFMDAVGFVNRVARKAEKSDHHPDIDIRWNKVTLTLSTHSEGGLTAKDFSMATECSAVFARFFARGQRGA